MRQLKISPDLKLPLDAVTQTIVVYGGKGMGKTNFGSVFAEELAKAALRFAVLDPMGVWWGLRHSPDGKGDGVRCLLLGGPHGDIPIEPTGGEVVADLVVDEQVNVVIDFSRDASGKMWSLGQKVKFTTAYALRLFQRQGELQGGRRRRPLMQILDEAARYVPQMIPSGQLELARSVGAWEQICEEGRNVGLGVCFLTQRSARLNKSVAELAELMLAFRTIGPNSIDAVTDWLGAHVPKEEIKQHIEQVRSLPVGSALAVSPGWLQQEGVVAIRARETFDSSATPKPGQQQRRVSGAGAKPDLAKYRERMAETIERAALDDPTKLRTTIIQLRRELKELQAAKQKPAPAAPKRVMVPIISDKQIAAVVAATERFRKTAQAIIVSSNDVFKAVELSRALSSQSCAPAAIYAPNPAGQRPHAAVAPRTDGLVRRQTGKFEPSAGTSGAAQLNKGERAVLTACAQYPSGVMREQITVLTGYKKSSRDTYLQRLGAAGLVVVEGGRICATRAGVDALGPDFEPLPTGKALQKYWLDRLGGGERAILQAVIAAWPNPISRDELSAQTDYKKSSRDTYLQRLTARRILIADRGGIMLARELVTDE